MLQIYRRLWQVNWAEQWQYRANLLMYLLYWLVSPVVYLAVWTTVANSQGDVNGLTANDFITYYLTLLIVDTLTSDITIHILPYKIQDGTLSGELLRPVHPILTNTLMNNLAFKALTFTALIPISLVLSLIFHPDYSSVTLQNVLLSLPAILLGFGINFFLGATITSLAFWTTRVYSISALAAALGAVPVALAQASTYPTKPVRVLVGCAPGGAVDIIARAIGQQITVGLGQPVVIENKPGAGTNIAMRTLIESAPDGHTLMLTADSIAANQTLYQPPPYDMARDFTPISLVGRVPVVLAANAQGSRSIRSPR